VFDAGAFGCGIYAYEFHALPDHLMAATHVLLMLLKVCKGTLHHLYCLSFNGWRAIFAIGMDVGNTPLDTAIGCAASCRPTSTFSCSAVLR
jgi:hypothetical protein